jgi:predicted esterase
MKTKLILFCLFIAISSTGVIAQVQFEDKIQSEAVDYVTAFKDTLNSLSNKSDNSFFKMHCNSMISIIGSKELSYQDKIFIENTYNAFNSDFDPANSKILTTYLNRERPFILSWISPTDGAVSFSWLTPPKDWDPENDYPLYIQLHGFWDVAGDPIQYMTYPFLNNPSYSFAFEDGYLLSPWGRGNLWYQGISEIDIWECMAALEEIVQINPYRKYLSGHSMGGYGAWSIASTSQSVWAALGIHAGALWYNNADLVNATVAENLKDLPTYFVCGTQDGLLSINQAAYGLLENAGNQDIEFVTFEGGHEYLESNVEDMYLWLSYFINDDLETDLDKPKEIWQMENEVRNFPNPVTTTTQILYNVAMNSQVNIGIYDIFGRKIESVVNEVKSQGSYEFSFDASGLNAGIYIIRMKTGSTYSESKMVVVK